MQTRLQCEAAFNQGSALPAQPCFPQVPAPSRWVGAPSWWLHLPWGLGPVVLGEGGELLPGWSRPLGVGMSLEPGLRDLAKAVLMLMRAERQRAPSEGECGDRVGG